MANPDRVLLDTSALYALISSSDEFHQEADAIYRRLLAGDTELWVTSYVLVEFGALVHHRLGFDILARFVDAVEGVFETVWLEARTHAEAWEKLNGRGGKGLNFVDWTTQLTAEALGATVFTFDGDFAREGSPVLPLAQT